MHTQGLACRSLDVSKILLVDAKTRIRISATGVMDVLNFDPNAANPMAGVHTHQQEDLVSLGKLIVCLACGSGHALQRDNISSAIELINRYVLLCVNFSIMQLHQRCAQNVVIFADSSAYRKKLE